MNTFLKKNSFFLFSLFLVFSFSSCSEEDSLTEGMSDQETAENTKTNIESFSANTKNEFASLQESEGIKAIEELVSSLEYETPTNVRYLDGHSSKKHFNAEEEERYFENSFWYLEYADEEFFEELKGFKHTLSPFDSLKNFIKYFENPVENKHLSPLVVEKSSDPTLHEIVTSLKNVGAFARKHDKWSEMHKKEEEEEEEKEEMYTEIFDLYKEAKTEGNEVTIQLQNFLPLGKKPEENQLEKDLIFADWKLLSKDKKFAYLSNATFSNEESIRSFKETFTTDEYSFVKEYSFVASAFKDEKEHSNDDSFFSQKSSILKGDEVLYSFLLDMKLFPEGDSVQLSYVLTLNDVEVIWTVGFSTKETEILSSVVTVSLSGEVVGSATISEEEAVRFFSVFEKEPDFMEENVPEIELTLENGELFDLSEHINSELVRPASQTFRKVGFLTRVLNKTTYWSILFSEYIKDLETGEE